VRIPTPREGEECVERIDHRSRWPANVGVPQKQAAPLNIHASANVGGSGSSLPSLVVGWRRL